MESKQSTPLTHDPKFKKAITFLLWVLGIIILLPFVLGLLMVLFFVLFKDHQFFT